MADFGDAYMIGNFGGRRPTTRDQQFSGVTGASDRLDWQFRGRDLVKVEIFLTNFELDLSKVSFILVLVVVVVFFLFLYLLVLIFGVCG